MKKKRKDAKHTTNGGRTIILPSGEEIPRTAYAYWDDWINIRNNELKPEEIEHKITVTKQEIKHETDPNKIRYLRGKILFLNDARRIRKRQIAKGLKGRIVYENIIGKKGRVYTIGRPFIDERDTPKEDRLGTTQRGAIEIHSGFDEEEEYMVTWENVITDTNLLDPDIQSKTHIYENYPKLSKSVKECMMSGAEVGELLIAMKTEDALGINSWITEPSGEKERKLKAYSQWEYWTEDTEDVQEEEENIGWQNIILRIERNLAKQERLAEKKKKEEKRKKQKDKYERKRKANRLFKYWISQFD